MNQSFSEYTRRDWVIAGLLTIFILMLVGMQLTPGLPIWAGDAAAYLSEGIAISNGTLEQQTAINYIMHPSPLPEEVHESRLVYVWGYPLLLSLVHRMVGFDMVNYSSIIFYKLPSLLAFSLMAGVLFLFYRRFFQEKLAVFLLKQGVDRRTRVTENGVYLASQVLLVTRVKVCISEGSE